MSAAPTVRVGSSEASTARTVLSEDEQEEFRVVITTRNERYFWISREGRELFHFTSCVYHWFIDPRGGGYVKVQDTSLLPELLRDPGPRFRYIEHVTLAIETITYWGSADTFHIDGSP